MIDSHIHLFEHGYRGNRSAGQELLDYAAYRDRFDITSCLVVGYEGDELHRRNNEYLSRIAVTHAWVRPLAYIAAEGGRSAVAALGDLPLDRFVGISLYLMTEMGVAGLMSWTMFEWAQVPEPGIVSVNTVPHLLPRIGEIAADHPRLTFMISHFGSPPGLGEGGVDIALEGLLGLAPIDNLHVKASGYYALTGRGWSDDDKAAATAMVIDAFGPDRVHWGSDFSPCLEATTFTAATSPPGIEHLTVPQRRTVQGDGLSILFAGPQS